MGKPRGALSAIAARHPLSVTFATELREHVGEQLPTGWADVDRAIGGLNLYGLHEWLGIAPILPPDSDSAPPSRDIEPPLPGIESLSGIEPCSPQIGSATHTVGLHNASATSRPDTAWQPPPPWQVARASVAARHARDPSTTRATRRWDPAKRWAAPRAPLIHLAWQWIEHDAQQRRTAERRIVWIGASCFPYPRTLVRGTDRRLLERSILVSPRHPKQRFTALDIALRSSAVSLIVADGTGLDMPATRWLHLLAQAQRCMVLLVRPTAEQDTLSAARTRWLVRATHPAKVDEVSTSRSMTSRSMTSQSMTSRSTTSPFKPAWDINLLRCKDKASAAAIGRSWRLEWDHAASCLCRNATLVDPTRSTPIVTPPRERSDVQHYRKAE